MTEVDARLTAPNRHGPGVHLVERISIVDAHPYGDPQTPALRTTKGGIAANDSVIDLVGLKAIGALADFVNAYATNRTLVVLAGQGEREAGATVYPPGRWPDLEVIIEPPLTEDGFGGTLRR